jgi:hypothetical protein
MMRRIFFLLIIALLVSTPVLAQEKQELTSKVYEIKYKDVNAIAQLLMSLEKGLVSTGSVNSSFNTITFRANEQGHTAAADLIRKFDVPAKTIEFQFFLIRASTTGEGLKDGLPEKVQRALKDVASLTRYKGFELIDAPFLRTQEVKIQSRPQTVGIKGRGIYNYVITVADPVVSAEENKRQIRIGGFNIIFNRPAADGTSPEAASPESVKAALQNLAAELSTPFSIAEGEIVVIGASQAESKASGPAIITIVTAKIL